ncbi:biotin/lipoyl-containing protein [Nocardia sp. NPDC127526]|uniref:biotin/lipoyl-containing protein n=1 Tax=Nocardia sp. NPDC127526 TaxID=3345393 RepID=UPI003645BDFF
MGDDRVGPRLEQPRAGRGLRVPPTAAEIGSRLMLNVHTDNPAAVRDELLAFNAWLLASSGFTRRHAATRAGINKSTVSNYCGAGSYKNVPESEPYTKFLRIFMIDPGHISVLVRRCEILKLRWDRYQKQPPPPPLPRRRPAVEWNAVDCGITIPAPGQLALKAAAQLRPRGGKQVGKYTGAELVSSAYYFGCGIDVPTDSHKQCELGALIHVSDLRPGDIVMLHSGQDTGLYDGAGNILTASVLGTEILPVPVMQFQRFSNEHFPYCGQRLDWPSEPLNRVDCALPARLDRGLDKLAGQFLDLVTDTGHSPGRFALAQLERMSPHATFDGSQIDLVRAAFEAAGYTLPAFAFATPLLGGPLKDLAVQVGDIVFTHGSGEVGLYAGGGDVMFRRTDGRLAMAVLTGDSDIAVRRAGRPRDDSATLDVTDVRGDDVRIVIPDLPGARVRGPATEFPVLDGDPVRAAETVAMMEHTVKQVTDKISAPRPVADDDPGPAKDPAAVGTAVRAPDVLAEGRVISWSKKPGDKVSINEKLLVISTFTRGAIILRAHLAGTITTIAATPGQTVAAGDVLCWIDQTRPPLRRFKRLFFR